MKAKNSLENADLAENTSSSVVQDVQAINNNDKEADKKDAIGEVQSKYFSNKAMPKSTGIGEADERKNDLAVRESLETIPSAGRFDLEFDGDDTRDSFKFPAMPEDTNVSSYGDMLVSQRVIWFSSSFVLLFVYLSNLLH